MRYQVIIAIIFLFFVTERHQTNADWKWQRISFGKSNGVPNLTVTEMEKAVNINENFTLHYTISGSIDGCVNLTIKSSANIMTTLPSEVICNVKNLSTMEAEFKATAAGIAILRVEADLEDIIDTTKAFTHISIGKSHGLEVISAIIGWIYTIAWDVSFLPQIVHNHRRRSVIGLSFDFLVLNFIGFTCYFLYNVGLYAIPSMQDEYYLRFSHSVLHVKINDVIFPLYALICTAIQLIQCAIYERGNQRVSIACWVISGLLLAGIFVDMILTASLENIWWIDFLYWLSYTKLAVSCIKYTPQLFENFKFKSTDGWNIWQVIFDCVGGSFSILQMIIISYNYDDFQSMLADPSKLGLGLLSIFFNIFFFIQHFCLYRNNRIIDSGSTKKEEIGL